MIFSIGADTSLNLSCVLQHHFQSNTQYIPLTHFMLR